MNTIQRAFSQLFFCLTLLVISSSVLANNKLTFGLGAGSFYSGIGINAGMQSATDIKYISVGCVSYSTIYGETCGAGIGWVSTDIFDFQTPKHGASVYVGVIGSESNNYDRKAVYGGSLGYHYFFSGIADSGFNVGFSVTAGNTDDGMSIGSMFQVGYQF